MILIILITSSNHLESATATDVAPIIRENNATALKGLNLIPLMGINASNGYLEYVDSLIMDMNGSILKSLLLESLPPVAMKLINSTTIMFTRVNYGKLTIWNFKTNKTN